MVNSILWTRESKLDKKKKKKYIKWGGGVGEMKKDKKARKGKSLKKSRFEAELKEMLQWKIYIIMEMNDQ